MSSANGEKISSSSLTFAVVLGISSCFGAPGALLVGIVGAAFKLVVPLNAIAKPNTKAWGFPCCAIHPILVTCSVYLYFGGKSNPARRAGRWLPGCFLL